MLGNIEGKQLYKYTADYVLFDLETTGISCNTDKVIEISALKVRNGRIAEEFSELVNPGMPIPYAASRVNNITDRMVNDAPHFDQVLERFLDFAGDDVLVGHNICTFDMKFIYRDCERYFGKTISNDYIDTLRLAKVIFPDWKHRRLSDLAEYYGISTDGAHRALADCKMNQQVFEHMGKELSMQSVGHSTDHGMEQNMGHSAEKIAEQNVENDNPIKICPECNMPMQKRNGRYGQFWGCTGFPRCRHTENL